MDIQTYSSQSVFIDTNVFSNITATVKLERAFMKNHSKK